MKKILLITNRLVIGGPSKHVAMLAKGLQNDFEVMVVGGNAAPGEVLALGLFAELKNQPILIPELSRKLSLSRDYKVYHKLRKIIHDFQADIVHTHTSKVGVIGRLAAKKEGVEKIIHTYHGLIFENYFSSVLNYGIIRLDQYLASFTNRIISLSDSQQNDLIYKYQISDSKKIKVIPLAIDFDEFESNTKLRAESRDYYGFKDNTVVIGIVGRVVPIKNLRLFFDGIHYLKNQGVYNYRVLVVGDGSEKEKIMSYVHNLDFSFSYGNSKGFAKKTAIHFASWQSNMAFVYAGLDIVALTSLSEGTPMSLMEAQLAGKAIIASDVGGVSSIVPKNVGLLFDVNKPNTFYDGLMSLVNNQPLRKKLGDNAERYAKKNYTISSMLDKINEVYNT